MNGVQRVSPLQVHLAVGVGEVAVGTDLVRLIEDHCELADGDIVVVTSKILSKAAGLTRHPPSSDRTDLTSQARRTQLRQAVISENTERVVARRGTTTIARTHHGLVLAAAGVDASNVAAGAVLALPADPDAAAEEIRSGLEQSGRRVGVLITDTAGRAWREGQTDIAIGAAGVLVLDDHAGRLDAHGNALTVTAPAVGDEIAALVDLVCGKSAGLPLAVVRGLSHLVATPADLGVHGRASALIRPEAQDMFGLGTREAVTAALTRDDARGFSAPAEPEELVLALWTFLELRGQLRPSPGDAEGTLRQVAVEVSAAQPRRSVLAERVATLAWAYGWTVDPNQPADGLLVLEVQSVDSTHLLS